MERQTVGRVAAIRRPPSGFESDRPDRPTAGSSREGADARGPGIVPPPFIYLVALFTGVALHRWWAIPWTAWGWSEPLAAGLILGGSAICLLAFLRFRRAGTSFNVRRPASTLVTEGLFRMSRNPAYVGLTIVYVGIGLLMSNVWVLLMLVPTLVVMDRWVVPREERHLESRFGDAYLHYKARVRRWL